MNFNDRLSQRARDTSRPELEHQNRGRALTEAEGALATALMEIYANGEQTPEAVARALAGRRVARPSGAEGAWTAEVFEAELKAINAALDAAYAEAGYGA